MIVGLERVRRTIGRDLERRGVPVPPDLIDAIVEGRETYWSLGGRQGIELPVLSEHRSLIEPLLDQHLPSWRELRE